MVTINTEKHVVEDSVAVTTTNVEKILAKAVTAPSNTVDTDCHRGGHIKAIWLSLTFCGLATSGVLQDIAVYLIKNPGDSLTPPDPDSVGSSNAKKFVVKQWHAMIMRNQDGNVPYHWEGWIKLPKRYHRMGTDDTWSLQVQATASTTGHFACECIYKWYR